MTGITYQLFGNLIEEVNDFENVKSTNSLATRAKRYMDVNYPRINSGAWWLVSLH